MRRLRWRFYRIISSTYIAITIMKLFFGWNPTIMAGVIAFVGAIIGGEITTIT